MNTGTRLHRIYDLLAAQVEEQSMVNTWADVFDLNKSLPHLEDEVTNLVLALRAEIKLARNRLDAFGVPANLTSPAFETLTQVASPGQLHTGWRVHRESINDPICRKVFEWVQWALEEEDEGEMLVDDMQKLQSEFDTLESLLRETDMSSHLRNFIQEQLRTIRSALRMYGVQGMKPVQDALQKVVGAYSTQDKKLAQAFEAADPPAKNVFQRASQLFEQVASKCDSLSKIKKAGQDAIELGRVFSKILLTFVN